MNFGSEKTYQYEYNVYKIERIIKRLRRKRNRKCLRVLCYVGIAVSIIASCACLAHLGYIIFDASINNDYM